MNQAVDYENQFLQQVVRFTGQGLTALGLEVLQVNLGLQCNQQCGHCHLQAGPGRKEVMDPYVMEGVIALADKLDLPEQRVVTSLARQGNTSAASVPLALDGAIRDGRIGAGQLLMMQGVGGGMSWGTVIARL